MLVFDLQCNQGHRFEGWFDSHKDLEKQIKKSWFPVRSVARNQCVKFRRVLPFPSAALQR